MTSNQPIIPMTFNYNTLGQRNGLRIQPTHSNELVLVPAVAEVPAEVPAEVAEVPAVANKKADEYA